MNEFLENLKREASANPVLALAAGAALITAVSKLLDAHGHAAGSKAYARQIDHKLRSVK